MTKANKNKNTKNLCLDGTGWTLKKKNKHFSKHFKVLQMSSSLKVNEQNPPNDVPNGTSFIYKK